MTSDTLNFYSLHLYLQACQQIDASQDARQSRGRAKKRSESEINHEKVQSIANAIDAGAYKIDASIIASKILTGQIKPKS